MLVRLVPKKSRRSLGVIPQKVQLIPYPWVIWLKRVGVLILTSPVEVFRFTSRFIARSLRGARPVWRRPVTPWVTAFNIQVSFPVASPSVPTDIVTACSEILLLIRWTIFPYIKNGLLG